MGYIYEDELKEILPEIMSDWIDKDDESWEWIFQEIEQKCYVGTNKKKGKQWRKYIEDVISILKSDISDLNDFHHELNKKVDELNKEVEEMRRKHIDEGNSMSREIARIHSDIRSVKSMAQTAKQRTEVDYTKCSKEKSEADVVQEIYNRMAGRGATREELDTFRNLIQKYDALEKKEIPVVAKECDTCKYYGRDEHSPCIACNHNDKWEAKDNVNGV